MVKPEYTRPDQEEIIRRCDRSLLHTKLMFCAIVAWVAVLASWRFGAPASIAIGAAAAFITYLLCTRFGRWLDRAFDRWTADDDDEETKRFLASLDKSQSLSLEDARTLALKALEAADFFLTEPASVAADLDGLPPHVKALFERYARIATDFGWLSHDSLSRPEWDPSLRIIGGDRGSNYAVRGNDEAIYVIEGDPLDMKRLYVHPEYPSVYHWILAQHPDPLA
ncbi:MAG: hypothetical protein KIS87_13780 [Phycisphaeraceae bacterium]|nr:hypothetical protein [Phycisphaeraceae bacterium]